MLFLFAQGRKTMKLIYSWDEIDWAEQDVTIARELGCSKERVRQRRLELGKRRSPDHCKHNAGVLRELLSMETEKMTLKDIARKVRYTEVSIARILRRNGRAWVKFDRRTVGKYRWDDADWMRSDREIAEALGVPNPATVCVKRRRLGVGRGVAASKEHASAGAKEKVRAIF